MGFQEYVAQPFDTLDMEAGPPEKELRQHFGRTVAKDTVLPLKVVAGETPFHFFKRQSRPNWIGILVRPPPPPRTCSCSCNSSDPHK